MEQTNKVRKNNTYFTLGSLGLQLPAGTRKTFKKLIYGGGVTGGLNWYFLGILPTLLHTALILL